MLVFNRIKHDLRFRANKRQEVKRHPVFLFLYKAL